MKCCLLISFELHSPNKNYLAVEKAIASLGNGVRVHTYFWYVESPMSAAEAADKLWQVMDERDSVLVIDAPEHDVGLKHVPHDVSKFIKRRARPLGQHAWATPARQAAANLAPPQRPTLVRLGEPRPVNEDAASS